MLAQRQAREALQQRVASSLELVDALQAELRALEQQLAAQLETAAPGAALLQRCRVVYVGGRPGANRSIRAVVQAAGGELVLHDGGIEDRKGLLARLADAPRPRPRQCLRHG